MNTLEPQKMNSNNTACDIRVAEKKKKPPKKPPRLSVSGKISNFPKQEKDKRNGKDINSGLGNKKVSEDKENTPHPAPTGTTPPAPTGTTPPAKGDHITMDEQSTGELDVAIIKKEASVETEHIYESISDTIGTKNTSSQTEECSPELRQHFNKADNFKVFRETSCQTESIATQDIKRNKKRNSDSYDENIVTLGKTKECRLSSSTSRTSTTSGDSADSGHFSGQVFNSPTHSENDNVQYLWQPEGLTNEEVKSFMNSLPPDKVPSKLSSDGNSYFKHQLSYQNPEQDADPTICGEPLTKDQSITLGNVWTKCLKAQATGKIQFSKGAGNACKSCGVLFHEKEATVVASNGSHHPSCFQCSVCHELLAKLTYHSDKDDRLFCARHYAELFKTRCHGCDELILSGKVIKAMDYSWHAEHFCCAKCGERITEDKYTKDQEQPMCLSCHETHYAPECKGCAKKIVIGQKILSHGDTHWHDECFICKKCENTLVLGSFNIANEKVVCNECYQQNKSKLCYKCGGEIKAGSQSVAYDSEFYHDSCFCCKSCCQPISSGFIEHEGSSYCKKCHHDLFSEKCVQCGLPVTGNGVTYNNQVWHGSCFECFYCHNPISSQRFLVRFGNRYCNGCYQKMFAKECHSCSELIKDEDYLTANDLSWHHQCFKCANCQRDLGNIGFHMVEQKTYCPECPG